MDLAVLQGSLDDVVARHELLRTLVVRDADPPYQQVFPPCRVPLEVRDLPPATGKSRDLAVQELFLEAEAGSISAREVPLMKALLCKFDDRDSVLFLTVHHSVSDGWSMQVIFRDLGAFYAARRTGTAAVLPQMRQYREYAEWQRASATSTAEDGAPAYWQHQLDGAREFTIPNDHGHPDSYSRPYSQHAHEIEPEVMTAASALATAYPQHLVHGHPLGLLRPGSPDHRQHRPGDPGIHRGPRRAGVPEHHGPVPELRALPHRHR